MFLHLKLRGCDKFELSLLAASSVTYDRKTCLKYIFYALGIFPELFRFDIFFCAAFLHNICFWSSTYFLHFYSRKVSREIFKTFNLRYIGNSEIRMAAWKFKLNLLKFMFSKKAIKISLSIWHLLHNVKSTVKISSIFVAFWENINFITFCHKKVW